MITVETLRTTARSLSGFTYPDIAADVSAKLVWAADAISARDQRIAELEAQIERRNRRVMK